MSWSKMCRCLCGGKKGSPEPQTPATPANSVKRIDVSIARMHRYTDTVIDIRVALRTPVIEYNPELNKSSI